METFQILFRSRRRIDREEVEGAIENYLSALSKNGQIIGDTPTARVSGGYRVFVNVPRADALELRTGNKWVRRAAKKLIEAGAGEPRVRRLGGEPTSRGPCTCRRPSHFVLFTDFMSDQPPVRCGHCFRPVPLYTFPPTSESGDFQDLLNWQSTYQAMDWLFIGSGAGEHYSHRQMSNYRSPLSQEGREVAATLEAKTRRPVYYYLMKHFGSSDARERRRKCPSCKKSWALTTPLHRIFDFRCDPCRLLSNVAFDVR